MANGDGLGSEAVGGSEIVLNLAYVALFASTFSRSVKSLRWALIAAAVAFIIFGSVVGIWSMVVWNLIIGSLHCYRQFKHFQARAKVSLSAEDERFRQMLFPDLNEFDFHLLWSLGEEGTMTGERLTTQGEPSDSVWLVLSGVVEVHTDGKLINRLATGSLVGEMSYLSEGPAIADTIPVGPVLLRRWPQSALRVFAEVNPTASKAFFEAISNDLSRKLTWRTLWA